MRGTDRSGPGRLPDHGVRAVTSRFLAMLAEAYGDARQIEPGLMVLTEALALGDKTGERFLEAELHRLKGKSCCGKPYRTSTGRRPVCSRPSR